MIRTRWVVGALLAGMSFSACHASHESAAQAQEPAAATKLGLVDAQAKAELGKPAPDFKLTDLNGKTVQLSSFKGKQVVLEWFDPTCPFCKGGYENKGPLFEQGERLSKAGIVWVQVNSANPNAQGSDLERNKRFVEQYALHHPLLFDPTGQVGRAYGAKTTPHMYLIDEQGVLRYRGAFDNAPGGTPEGGAAKVNYVDAALADLKAGRAVQLPDTKSYG